MIAPEYAAARRALLDVLIALNDQTSAIVVVGAQAVYLRTGEPEVGVAPFTTDSDLVIDPNELADEPTLIAAMENADFVLLPAEYGGGQPGRWYHVPTASRPLIVPIDLLVPETMSPPGGRRGARLGPHGTSSARKVSGLEAAIVDNSIVEIAALETTDPRRVASSVAGPAALITAKLHKIHDRLSDKNGDRSVDKDAADALRLMQTVPIEQIAAAFETLLTDRRSAASTRDALQRLRPLFGAARSPGVQMASRALRVAVPEARVRALCTGFVAALSERLPLV